jgi:hypothetical protein
MMTTTKKTTKQKAMQARQHQPATTIEDALHVVEDRTAVLRFLADAVRDVNDAPEPAFFAGLAAMLRETEETIRAVRRALDVQALGAPIGGRRS